MARPTKCTPELTEQISEYLAAGNFIKPACEAVGIDESSYHKWRQRGRDELERVEQDPRRRVRKSEKPYVEFLKATNRARGEAEARCVRALTNAALSGDWRAAVAYLERAHSERWNKQVDLAGALDLTTGGRPLDGGPSADDIEEMEADEKTAAFKDMIRGANPDEG